MAAKDAKTGYDVAPHIEAEIARKIWYEVWGNTSLRFDPDCFEDIFGDEMKWYHHEDDMIALSKEYPDIVFVLEGEGEEAPDFWRMWVCNGEWEKVYAELVYPMPKTAKFMPHRI
jgi:hypothetical protein